jgi:glycosyltransferase involved in cell wall biosynthesis
MERWAKNFEDVIFDIADKVYVASNFIKQDVIKKRLIDPNKLVVTGLPLDTIELDKYKDKYEKEDLVVFNGRNVDEKQPWLFEQLQHRLKSTNIGFVNTLKQNYSKEEYYELLATAKVVVSYALQENFGFGVNEAVYLGCKPVLPNRLVYPEFFSKEYLYQTFDESVEKVDDFVTFYRQPENILPNFNDSIRRWFDE